MRPPSRWPPSVCHHVFRFAHRREWPELVFHVLAHVRATAHVAASVYDATYVAFVERHVGPASRRPLEEDAQILGQLLPTHEALARAQLVAALFQSSSDATRHADTDLDALETVSPSLRAALRPIAQGAELLRCAALLESEMMAALPAVKPPDPRLRDALARVERASPTLRGYTLVPIRALRLRGRLVGSEIWHGVPARDLELDPDHVAWQVAHEASVGEVVAAKRPLAEREVEHVALVLMAERAAHCGLAEPHSRWLAHFGGLPELRRRALSAEAGQILDTLRSSDDSA